LALCIDSFSALPRGTLTALSISVEGLAAVCSGLDKVFNVLTNWNVYLSSITARFPPSQSAATKTRVQPPSTGNELRPGSNAKRHWRILDLVNVVLDAAL